MSAVVEGMTLGNIVLAGLFGSAVLGFIATDLYHAVRRHLTRRRKP